MKFNSLIPEWSVSNIDNNITKHKIWYNDKKTDKSI